ncbi:hypothetical protein SY2F82_65920 [Streptomyces sp. Y2F8-2]|nr:hypothetical protein SY2F82_65920 [Streptomyces sp. Y2F8-2]
MQPGPPPVPGQQPVQAGLPPVPGQAPVYGGPPPVPGPPPAQLPYPVQPGPPFQARPLGQQPSASGNPVGAVLLGFFVSVVVSLLYSGLILATYKDQSLTTANTLYLAHALLNGAIVGSLVGLMAHRSNGARIGGAVIAALGAFFGYVNAIPLVFAWERSPMALMDLLEAEPFFPAKAWWTSEAHGGVDWFSPLGLVVAAAAAWGLAYVVGNRRGQI